MRVNGENGEEGIDERLFRVTEYIRASLNENPDYRQLSRLAHRQAPLRMRGSKARSRAIVS